MRRRIRILSRDDECAQSFLTTFVYEIPGATTKAGSPSVADFQKWAPGQIYDKNTATADILVAIAATELQTYAELETLIP